MKLRRNNNISRRISKMRRMRRIFLKNTMHLGKILLIFMELELKLGNRGSKNNNSRISLTVKLN
jgi:hypothetical protein